MVPLGTLSGHTSIEAAARVAVAPCIAVAAFAILCATLPSRLFSLPPGCPPFHFSMSMPQPLRRAMLRRPALASPPLVLSLVIKASSEFRRPCTPTYECTRYTLIATSCCPMVESSRRREKDACLLSVEYSHCRQVVPLDAEFV